MNFSISAVEHERIRHWLNDLYPHGLPYGGAAGGHLSYIFTPTSLGVAFEVKENVSGKTINLTRYEDW